MLAAAAAGVVLAAALPPSSLWPLVAVLAVPFGLIAASRGPGEAMRIGAATAVPFFAIYVLWLPASFSALLGPAFWLLFPPMLAVLALIWGATAAVARLVGRDGPGTLLVLAPLWVAVEWLRGIGFFGFPWGTLGYALVDTPIAQLADVVGVHGLSLLVTAVAAALAAPFVPARSGAARGFGGLPAPRRRSPLRFALPPLALALVAVAWWGGGAREARIAATLPEPDRTALLVQGNVDPFGRATSASRELDVHTELSAAAVEGLAEAPELIVWPEGAVVGFPLVGFRGEPVRTAIQAASPESAFVVGGRADVEGGSTNTLFAIEDGALRGRYDKHVLVPFGERWPLRDAMQPVYRAVFGVFGLPLLENTVPGTELAVLATDGGTIGAYVCYESVFPRIPRRMVANGADVLVNATNDAWFSAGAGARQHYDMGRLRAIETRRWVLRAANDGVTGAVDPLGRTTESLPRFTRDALLVEYATLDRLTPFVRHGELTPWILAGASLVAGLVAAFRRRD